jgi:hypothetical protein
LKEILSRFFHFSLAFSLFKAIIKVYLKIFFVFLIILGIF